MVKREKRSPKRVRSLRTKGPKARLASNRATFRDPEATPEPCYDEGLYQEIMSDYTDDTSEQYRQMSAFAKVEAGYEPERLHVTPM